LKLKEGLLHFWAQGNFALFTFIRKVDEETSSSSASSSFECEDERN